MRLSLPVVIDFLLAVQEGQSLGHLVTLNSPKTTTSGIKSDSAHLLLTYMRAGESHTCSQLYSIRSSHSVQHEPGFLSYNGYFEPPHSFLGCLFMELVIVGVFRVSHGVSFFMRGFYKILKKKRNIFYHQPQLLVGKPIILLKNVLYYQHFANILQIFNLQIFVSIKIGPL